MGRIWPRVIKSSVVRKKSLAYESKPQALTRVEQNRFLFRKCIDNHAHVHLINDSSDLFFNFPNRKFLLLYHVIWIDLWKEVFHLIESLEV